MAFPFITAEGFESGSTIFTASSGTLIDVPHYTELARQGMAPYRGAYCGRVRLAGGTTSQFWREDTSFDNLTSGVTSFIRWYFYLGKDLVMAASDKFSMFEAESTLNTTTEIAAGILNNAGNLEFWWNETQAAASPQTIVLGTTTTALGQWYHAEVKIVMDAPAAGNGTITGYINDAAGTAITTLTQAAIVDAKFGTIGPDAGTSGTVLIDDIIYDEPQIYADRRRYRAINSQMVQANDHIILGPGRFSAGVTGTGTNAVLSLYDTDIAANRLEPFAVLRNVSANEFIPGHDIFEVGSGLYAVMSGTAAQAFFSIESGGYVSDAQVIQAGLRNGTPKS